MAGDGCMPKQLDQTADHRGGLREMLIISVPMVVSQACHTAMTFTDRWFMGRIGPEQMNAAMGGGLASFMSATFFLGLTGYTTALVAQYLGAGKKERCAVALSQALIIALVAYPLILLAGRVIIRLFDAANLPPEQLGPQKEYFGILIYGSVIMLLHSCLASFFSGIGRTRVVMLAALGAMVVNIGANWVLIFGKLGFPQLGITGAAYGTLIGGAFGLALLACTYFTKANRAEFDVVGSLRLCGDTMRKLLKYGYPAGLEMFLNMLAFLSLVTLFQSHSLQTATAITIVFNWDMVSFVPLLGIQIGVMSLVGRYMGAGEPEIAHQATMSGLKAGCAYSSVVLILFVFFPTAMVGMFRPDTPNEVFASAFESAVFMIRFAALYVLIEAAVVVFSGALRGAGDTFWAMCFSVSIHWLMFGALLVVLRVLKLDPKIAWVVMVLSFLCASVILFLRYRGGKWKQRRVLSAPVEVLATDHDQDFHATIDA